MLFSSFLQALDASACHILAVYLRCLDLLSDLNVYQAPSALSVRSKEDEFQ